MQAPGLPHLPAVQDFGRRECQWSAQVRWVQKLDFHPHVHCVVPGGGVLPDGSWKPAQKGFFIPIRVMSALFRGKFLAALKQMRQTGSLEYHGSAAALAEDGAFKSLLRELYKTGWVVYAKATMCSLFALYKFPPPHLGISFHNAGVTYYITWVVLPFRQSTGKTQ